MPIVTRRQSALVCAAPTTVHAAAGEDGFVAVVKPVTRRSLAPRTSTKDSNLLVDLSAPLCGPAPSPFKPVSTQRRRATIATVPSKQLAFGKENEHNSQQQPEPEEDESDRAWAELNKPTLMAVVTPAKTKRTTRASFGLQAPTSAIGSADFETLELKTVPAPTTSQTPNPRRARRASTRGSGMKAAAPAEEIDEFDFSGSIATSFSDDEESVPDSRASIAPLSLTPSSYKRTRASHQQPSVRKSDRRSLHHTQLQLLKQLVQDETDQVPEGDEQEIEEEEEQQQEVPVEAEVVVVPEETVEVVQQQEEVVTEEVFAVVEQPQIVASLPKPTPAKVPASARKSRQSVAPARKSLFESSAFTFHGVTPPATPLDPVIAIKNRRSIAQASFIDEELIAAPATPIVPSASAQRAITPRSHSRRKSFSERREDEEVDDDASTLVLEENEAPLPCAMFDLPATEEIEEFDVSEEALLEQQHDEVVEHQADLYEQSCREQEAEAEQFVFVAPQPKIARTNTPIAPRTPTAQLIASYSSSSSSASKSHSQTPMHLAPVSAISFSSASSDASDEVMAERSRSATSFVASSPSPAKQPTKRSKKSLVNMVACDYANKAGDIPDDILQQLFTRAPKAGETKDKAAEKTEQIVVAKEAEIDQPRVIVAKTPKKQPVAAVPVVEEEVTMRTPARSSRQSVVPATPFTPFSTAAKPLTPLTATAFVERVSTSPRDRALYALAFAAVLAALVYAF